MIRHTLIAIALAAGLVAASAPAQRAGVVGSPDALVRVYAEKGIEAAVIATVKTGEPFTFELENDPDWAKVTLASGKSGWMQLSRIRLYFTEKDLPTKEKDPAGPSEIDEFARGRGFDYARDTRRAARGDFKALKKFFEIAHDADGAAAESISGIPTVVYHLLGDAQFAKFLAAQPVSYRMMVRNLILGDGLVPAENLKFARDFPESSALLFPPEIVAWFSPDGLYAIRKVFSDQFELRGSKVVRAELIEKKSGKVLCDLTGDDIGTSAEREGEALWSPDSKRVACLSSDLTEQEGNVFTTPPPAPQRKQAVVYQLSGESFIRVELSLGEAPGDANDPELKAAVLCHQYTEPIRWQKSNVLILRRHEYYRVKKPMKIGNETFDTIHDLGRGYQITATITPDGKGALTWKRHD